MEGEGAGTGGGHGEQFGPDVHGSGEHGLLLLEARSEPDDGVKERACQAARGARDEADVPGQRAEL